LAVSRARKDLGYTPKYDVEQGSADYARWLLKGQY